jgi:flagellar biosynthesis protein FlhB
MSNPYESPPTESKTPVARKIDVIAAYKAVFAAPDYMSNLGMVFVFAIIPVINQVMILGYQFEVVEHLHKNPGAKIPSVNFDRFSHYLMRGLWPFVVNLLLGMVFIAIVGVVFCVFLGIIQAIGAGIGGDVGGALTAIGMGLLYLLYFPMLVLLMVAMFPFTLRAGLSKDFASAFDFDYAKHFFKTVGMKFAIATLFFMFLASLAGMVGTLLCCIGLFAAIPVIVVAQAHLYWQTYEFYLAKGGQPVPLKGPEDY